MLFRELDKDSIEMIDFMYRLVDSIIDVFCLTASGHTAHRAAPLQKYQTAKSGSSRYFRSIGALFDPD